MDKSYNRSAVTNGIKNYDAIDLFKFLLSFVVVAIHTEPFENFRGTLFFDVWSRIIAIAVPFFFISQGYLLSAKMKATISKSRKIEIVDCHLKKIINMYVTWSLIYLPMTLGYYVHNLKNGGKQYKKLYFYSY